MRYFDLLFTHSPYIDFEAFQFLKIHEYQNLHFCEASHVLTYLAKYESFISDALSMSMYFDNFYQSLVSVLKDFDYIKSI